MPTVKIIQRTSVRNSKGQSPLRIRLLHEDQSKEITLPGTYMLPKFWDEKNQVVLGNKMLNIRVQNELSKYSSCLNKLLFLNEEIVLSEVVKSVINPNHKLKQKVKNPKVVDYIKQEFVQNTGLTYATRKTYNSLLSTIEKYDQKVKIGNVNGAYLNKFQKYLNKNGLSIGTIHNKMKCLKRSINRAYEENLIPQPDWRGYKVTKGKPTKKFVQPHNLSKLKKLYLNQTLTALDSSILRAFLFSCFASGARFGDLCTLTYESISVEGPKDNQRIRFSYTMRKTNKRITMILNKTSSSFINPTKAGKKEMLFGLIQYATLQQDQDTISKKIESANAYANKRLKILAKRAGLERSITFHLSRHSFICNALSLGIDHFTIKELAGVSVKVLEDHYAKVVDESKTRALELMDNL